MNADEFLGFLSKWRKVFSIFGAVLALILIDLVAFHPVGMHQALDLSIGFVCVLICLYAGKKLRDVERVDAIIDADELMLMESHDID